MADLLDTLKHALKRWYSDAVAGTRWCNHSRTRPESAGVFCLDCGDDV